MAAQQAVTPSCHPERSAAKSKDLRTIGYIKGYVYVLCLYSLKLVRYGAVYRCDKQFARRLYEHRNHLVKGFAEKYQTNKLVFYEATGDIRVALEREKQLKGWSRTKKNTLIAQSNPEWKDLSAEWDLWSRKRIDSSTRCRSLRMTFLWRDGIRI